MAGILWSFFLLFVYVQTDGSRLASNSCHIRGRILQAQASYASMQRHSRNSVNTRDIVHFGEPRISHNINLAFIHRRFND